MAADAVWRPIPGFSKYKVSNAGDVMRVAPSRGTRPGKILKTPVGKVGYQTLTITDDDGHKRKTYVHRLVCAAFHGAAPTKKHEVAHYDGEKLNNRADNLRWATSTENKADTLRHGRSNRGGAEGRAKLSVKTVLEIRRRLADGRRVTQIAREFGIAHTLISNVKRGKSWAWLQTDGKIQWTPQP